MRLVQADLLRLRGDAEGALFYVSSMDARFPPDEADLVSLIGIKKTRGYCLGHLGR